MNVVKKVVVVTNSHSDIGEETALQFAALGCKMVLVGSDDAEIRQVALKCRQKSPREMRADLTVDAERVKLVDSVIDHYDRIDILVNNFDHGTFTPIDDANLIRNYDKILNADLRPLLHLIYLFRAHLEKSKGNIVNVSSVFGMRPVQNFNWTKKFDNLRSLAHNYF
ncbi:3-oxoacyl-[acyl-carrier-protein] reductase-like protein [Dinothrombium tinctorium]|uniref:3-oxoacyl-[acyl-carrier-protein] reductase-like protein n=1 Tax=Dinothrombium tinctorium TaxID=1965070 RepID=A0A443QZ87_9ACAR|nr:3-oxoacyl-[acyl-carrier-protein] reductase-like protein [Dinothrombium tinctorium]